jgi:hypothetical protein
MTPDFHLLLIKRPDTQGSSSCHKGDDRERSLPSISSRDPVSGFHTLILIRMLNKSSAPFLAAVARRYPGSKVDNDVVLLLIQRQT